MYLEWICAPLRLTGGQVHSCRRNMSSERILHINNMFSLVPNKYVHIHARKREIYFILCTNTNHTNYVACMFCQQLVLWCFTLLSQNWITILCKNDVGHLKLHQVNGLCIQTPCTDVGPMSFKTYDKTDIFLWKLETFQVNVITL